MTASKPVDTDDIAPIQPRFQFEVKAKVTFENEPSDLARRLLRRRRAVEEPRPVEVSE